MKIETMTVVPADKTIVVNGEAYACDGVAIESAMPQYGVVHALQWFGPHGHLEYEKGPAIGFVEKDKLKPYVDLWRHARSKALRGKRDDIVRHHGQTVTQIADHKEMIGHLVEQIDALDVQLAGADEATKGGIVNTKTRLANTLDRMKSELAEMETAEVGMKASAIAASDAADAAESDLSSPIDLE